VLGGRVFDRAGKIRILLGPLDREGYERLRHPEARSAVAEIAGAFADSGIEHELVLVLAPGAAPPLRLDSTGAFRLGRNAWLGHQGREATVVMAGARDPVAPAA
jgi:predicted component of type VI protein secretion system